MKVSDINSLLEICELNVLSLGIFELCISLNDNFVVSLKVSDIWIDEVSDINSLLEICELNTLSFGIFELCISFDDSFSISL